MTTLLFKNSDLIRKNAIDILKQISPVIEFETKRHYGGPELVYVTSAHKDSLQALTGAKTLNSYHIKALKQLGFSFKQKGMSEKILTATEQCHKCKGTNAYVRGMSPDTDMNEMVIYCPDCKNHQKIGSRTAVEGLI